MRNVPSLVCTLCSWHCSAPQTAVRAATRYWLFAFHENSNEFVAICPALLCSLVARHQYYSLSASAHSSASRSCVGLYCSTVSLLCLLHLYFCRTDSSLRPQGPCCAMQHGLDSLYFTGCSLEQQCQACDPVRTCRPCSGFKSGVDSRVGDIFRAAYSGQLRMAAPHDTGPQQTRAALCRTQRHTARLHRCPGVQAGSRPRSTRGFSGVCEMRSRCSWTFGNRAFLSSLLLVRRTVEWHLQGNEDAQSQNVRHGSMLMSGSVKRSWPASVRPHVGWCRAGHAPRATCCMVVCHAMPLCQWSEKGSGLGGHSSFSRRSLPFSAVAGGRGALPHLSVPLRVLPARAI